MNKIRKYLLTTLLLVGVVSCQNEPDNNKEWEVFNKARPSLSEMEETILARYYKEHSVTGYDTLLSTIIKARAYKDITNLKSSKVPFCDVLVSLQQNEAESGRSSDFYRTDISGQWFFKTGETLRDSCNTENRVDDQPTLVVYTPDVPEKDIVTLEKGKLLSPSKYRELINVAKECKGAKVRLLNVIDSGRLLTDGDYEAVTKIALQCEAFKLQTELNK